MNNTLIEQAGFLHQQIAALVAEVKALRKENEKMHKELERKNEEAAAMQKQNKTMQSLLDVNTLSKIISVKQDHADVRKRIDKLVRELDTVIHYLEKN